MYRRYRLKGLIFQRSPKKTHILTDIKSRLIFLEIAQRDSYFWIKFLGNLFIWRRVPYYLIFRKIGLLFRRFQKFLPIPSHSLKSFYPVPSYSTPNLFDKFVPIHFTVSDRFLPVSYVGSFPFLSQFLS